MTRRSNNLPARESNGNGIMTATASIYSGPLPSPETLRKYEEILEGSANRIVTMAENQGEHRRELEKKVIEGRIKDSRLGIFCGLTIGMTALICGTIVIIFGHSAEGLTMGSAGIVGLVGVFVYGTRANRKEREKKDLH